MTASLFDKRRCEPMMLRSVCVLGGCGFIGRHLVHMLGTGSMRVTVATRRRERGKELILLPAVDVVECDIRDARQLERVIAGHDAVINLIGILRPRRRESFQNIHAELPRRIVDACRAQGVMRLLHVSALGATHDAPSEYLRSKADGEEQVRLAEAAGIHTTIVRPSVVFGADDTFLQPLLRLMRVSPILPLPCASARIQPVFVDDVARACVGALHQPATYGQSLQLCGPEVYTFIDLVRWLAQRVGVQPVLLPLNMRASMLFAALTEWLPRSPLSRDMVRSARRDNVCAEKDSPLADSMTSLNEVVSRWLSDREITMSAFRTRL
jgi:uncharacterized protein YbjT (DUF2867 family)